MRPLTKAAALGLALLLAPVAGLAGDRYDARKETVAIKGYDAVAYFTVGKPVLGKPEYSHDWNGKTWHFSTAEHRTTFAEAPGQFAPRYGGFCAGAMALGWRAPVDPEAFAIIDGKLYLAYHREGIEEFEREAGAKVLEADRNWDRIGTTN